MDEEMMNLCGLGEDLTAEATRRAEAFYEAT
jgi:hypothetical protein